MIRLIPAYGTKETLFKIKYRDIYLIRKGIRKALFQMGRESVLHTRKLIRDRNKTGRIYLFKGRKHQASAPGEAPAKMTGDLIRSVGYVVRGYLETEFGDKIFYGKYLEDGTKKMGARPHLVRTAKEKEADNKKILLLAVDRKINETR